MFSKEAEATKMRKDGRQRYIGELNTAFKRLSKSGNWRSDVHTGQPIAYRHPVSDEGCVLSTVIFYSNEAQRIVHRGFPTLLCSGDVYESQDSELRK